MTEDDAVAMLNAGASLIQIYTGFIYNGPQFVKRICKRLKQEAEEQDENGTDRNPDNANPYRMRNVPLEKAERFDLRRTFETGFEKNAGRKRPPEPDGGRNPGRSGPGTPPDAPLPQPATPGNLSKNQPIRSLGRNGPNEFTDKAVSLPDVSPAAGTFEQRPPESAERL